jgi:hypothetical protein
MIPKPKRLLPRFIQNPDNMSSLSHFHKYKSPTNKLKNTSTQLKQVKSKPKKVKKAKIQKFKKNRKFVEVFIYAAQNLPLIEADINSKKAGLDLPDTFCQVSLISSNTNSKKIGTQLTSTSINFDNY